MDPIQDLVPDAPRIRYMRQGHRSDIVVKQNLICNEAGGEIIIHWDDDDWMAPWRLSYQVKGLLDEQADVCGLDKLLYYDVASDQVWQYVYPKMDRPRVGGGSFCYTKALWKRNSLPNVIVGKDIQFV